MKKLLASFLLVTYLVLSCGVVINYHYCMDKLASTKLFFAEGKYCDNCGMHTDDSHGCCRDEIQVIKIREDQQKAMVTVELKVPSVEIAFTPSLIELPFENADHIVRHLIHPPPLLSEQDTYLQNRVFRI